MASLYKPNIDSLETLFDVESAITFMDLMINDLDPAAPTYREYLQHYHQQIALLGQKKLQFEAQTRVGSEVSGSVPNTPNESASAGSSIVGYGSSARKRSYPPDSNANDNYMSAKRRNENTNTMSGGLPLQLPPMQPQFEVAGAFSSQPDPFSELSLAFRDLNNGQALANNTPADTNIDYMTSDDLAMFLNQEPLNLQAQQTQQLAGPTQQLYNPQFSAAPGLSFHGQPASTSYLGYASNGGFNYGDQPNWDYQPAVQQNWNFQQGAQLPPDFQFGIQQTPTFQFGGQPTPAAYAASQTAPGIPSGVLPGNLEHEAKVPNLGHQFPQAEYDSEDEIAFESGTVTKHLEELIEGITDDDEVARELREETPRIMKSPLMEHQKLGLAWLKKAENSNIKGGILADDMGLGKTVQAIALIAARPSDDPARKTTLIIAPVALMRQWAKEIERHVLPKHKLSVYIYHGNKTKADFNRLRMFDIVLTTFGTLSSEMKQKEKVESSENPDRPIRGSKGSLGLLGRECAWYRVIIDEAQCIKNHKTIASKAANELQAKYRLCMTGTPMMNSITELYSLIRFLHIKPYNDLLRFQDHIIKPIKRSPEKAIQRVQVLLRTFMLRRTKQTMIDGNQICDLPPKHIHHNSVNLKTTEQNFYRAIEARSQNKIMNYLEKGTATKNYASILVLLLRLRQACCHPHLVKDFNGHGQVSTEGIDDQDLLERATSLHPNVVERLKDCDGFECPICMEGILNPTVFLPCGHNCCGECFQKLIDPTQAIQQGDETGGAKCPECRGPLKADKITDYRHFCQVHCREKLSAFGFIEEDEMEGDETESDSDGSAEESDEDDEGDDLKGFIVPDDVFDDDSSATEGITSPASDKKPKQRKNKKTKTGKPKVSAKPKQTLAQLKKDSCRNKEAKKKYLRRLEKIYVGSAKLENTIQLVTEIRKNDPTEKILVFSQFTTLLDLLEVPLRQLDLKYQRYDGSMKMDDRADAVNTFMDDNEHTLMLISLKAGNAGLNLNKASQVILLDPFWNPFIEDQAVDRAHRMPQKRPVHVHRLLVPNTVEDRIIMLQDRKREMINAALDEKAAKGISRLSINDIKYLFGLGGRAPESEVEI